MAASSVTGTGPGESFGKQKPELHSGCGCCGGKSDASPRPPRSKIGCAIRRSVSSMTVRYSSGASISKTGACI